MKLSMILVIFTSLYIIAQVAALTPQNVGGDFGKSWLLGHGMQPNIARNITSLWNWGNVPKGYVIYNGKPIPPGSGPQRYYPSFITNSTPIVTNSTVLNSIYGDPWVLAEFTGRPIVVVDTTTGLLF